MLHPSKNSKIWSAAPNIILFEAPPITVNEKSYIYTMSTDCTQPPFCSQQNITHIDISPNDKV